MRAWIRILLTVVGFLSVLGLIGLQIYSRTTFVSTDRAVSRDEQPGLYWVVIGLQVFLLISSAFLMVAQVMLGI